jgi:hypothetical protein
LTATAGIVVGSGSGEATLNVKCSWKAV